MKVWVKDFNVEMEIRTKGVELEVRNPSNKHIGDLIVTKTGLIWCKGRTTRKHGIPVSWDAFQKWMES